MPAVGRRAADQPSAIRRWAGSSFELTTGGEGATVSLCPGSVHHLQAPIRFTAPLQTLTTHGDAVGHDRAMIIVEGEDQSVAI